MNANNSEIRQGRLNLFKPIKVICLDQNYVSQNFQHLFYTVFILCECFRVFFCSFITFGIINRSVWLVGCLSQHGFLFSVTHFFSWSFALLFCRINGLYGFSKIPSIRIRSKHFDSCIFRLFFFFFTFSP